MREFLFLSMSSDTPIWIFYAIYIFALFVLVIIPFSYCVGYFERKFTADLQARIGPSLTGLKGFLQLLADHIKLFRKSSPPLLSKIEMVWIFVAGLALYSTLGVLPFGSGLIFFDSELGLLVPLFSFYVLALAMMLLGVYQENIKGYMSGFRIGAQAVAGSFPCLICIVTIGLSVGSLGWSAIIGTQGFGLSSWSLFSSPFMFISGFVFYLSGMVMLSLSPMDSSLRSFEIMGGISSQFYGRQLSLFKLGRFYALFFWTLVFTLVYLGAWNLPDAITTWLTEISTLMLQLFQLLFILFKTFLILILVFWQSRVSPQLRVDQINDYAWKVLGPLSLFALIGEAIWCGGFVV